MPGQYKFLCREFARDKNNKVVFITKPRNVNIDGVHKVEYAMRRDASPQTHRYLINAERGILQGQEVWRMCKKLKEDENFIPDIVVTHPGWGDALFVKEIFKGVPVLSFFEFYYHPEGADVGFDPDTKHTDDDFARIRAKNIVNLMALEQADWGVSPTFWQRDVHPEIFHPKISVLHDGIDTDIAKPNPDVTLTLANGKQLSRKNKVVTYIARNFEPYRGFPTFMRAAEIILKERKDVDIIAVGADGVSYGKKLGSGETWRQKMLGEVKLDKNRIHFPGIVSYSNLMKLFQISSAHIYLTYPFVLSWSALESMACGVPLVASSTTPTREIVTDGENGLLADFHSPENVAKHVLYMLDNPEHAAQMQKNARKTIMDNYALKDLLPLHMDLVRDVAKGEFPPPTHAKIMKRYI